MKNQEDKPASFIGKLYNILRSKEYAKIIYWDTEHKGIRILNQKKLQEIILPKYFRHNRFSSFVRQLNMYDFHKTHLGDHRSIFIHSEFDPKKKDNIHLIRRKITFQPKGQSQKQEVADSNYQPQIDKENYNCFEHLLKSSRGVLCKNSLNILVSQNATNFNNLTEEKALSQLIKDLQQIKFNTQELQERIKHLKTDQMYRKYLIKKPFLARLYDNLGVEMGNDDDCLSVLSIEEELLCKTRKSLVPRSLKLLESGPLYYRKDTIRNFLNF